MRKSRRANINIQHQPIHSFIVFRYVFIVQQFAPMAPAVHFDEVFVQGFVICTNTHYVISFIISLTLLLPSCASEAWKRWLQRVTNGLSLAEFTVGFAVMIKNCAFIIFPSSSLEVCEEPARLVAEAGLAPCTYPRVIKFVNSLHLNWAYSRQQKFYEIWLFLGISFMFLRIHLLLWILPTVRSIQLSTVIIQLKNFRKCVNISDLHIIINQALVKRRWEQNESEDKKVLPNEKREKFRALSRHAENKSSHFIHHVRIAHMRAPWKPLALLMIRTGIPTRNLLFAIVCLKASLSRCCHAANCSDLPL